MATVQALLLRHFAEVFDAELVPATAPDGAQRCDSGCHDPRTFRERSA
jgi:hypothetical protein